MNNAIKLYLIKIGLGVVGTLLFAGGGYWLWQNSSAGVEDVVTIQKTPTTIEDVEDLGQWCFMSIYNEEIVDSTIITQRRFMPDKKRYLARIYKGTLHIGFDLKKDVEEGWIKIDGDKVSATLPHLHLLDDKFIDEANTDALIEDGEWTHAERQALYYKAEREMREKCLTPYNFQKAEEIAIEQMTDFFKMLGFKNIQLQFQAIETPAVADNTLDPIPTMQPEISLDTVVVEQ